MSMQKVETLLSYIAYRPPPYGGWGVPGKSINIRGLWAVMHQHKGILSCFANSTNQHKLSRKQPAAGGKIWDFELWNARNP